MMPGMDGYETCRRIKERRAASFTPVIMVTAKADTDSLVRGFEAGADEYVTKPIEPVELMARVRAMLRIREMYLENRALRGELRQTFRFENIVGQSPAMKKVFGFVERVLNHDVTVLLTVARPNRKGSYRAGHPLQRPAERRPLRRRQLRRARRRAVGERAVWPQEGLVHRAIEDEVGLFEAAEGGTVFLDEISETSPGMQVKLLRVLQEGEVTRVGETKPGRSMFE